jgi:hypothetical protein
MNAGCQSLVSLAHEHLFPGDTISTMATTWWLLTWRIVTAFALAAYWFASARMRMRIRGGTNGQSHAAVARRGRRIQRFAQAQHVRSKDLFRQRVIGGRRNTSVQGTGNFGNPVVVEGVKDARVDAGPIVDGMDMSSAPCG